MNHPIKPIDLVPPFIKDHHLYPAEYQRMVAHKDKQAKLYGNFISNEDVALYAAIATMHKVATQMEKDAESLDRLAYSIEEMTYTEDVA